MLTAIVCLALFTSLLPLSSQPGIVQAEGREPSLQHCTDWPDASYKQGADSADIGISNYQQGFFGGAHGTYATIPLSVIPQSTDWQVLVRDNSPFAVFYTEKEIGNKVFDLVTPTGSAQATPFGNYDEDNDDVPDYVERVLHCLSFAFERYKAYYAETDYDWYFKYLPLTYDDPVTGAKISKKVYPVVIQQQSQRGTVGPVIFSAGLTGLGDYAPTATYMTIDRSNGTFPREGGMAGTTWLYPYLETTIYHELAHAFQGFFRIRKNPGDVQIPFGNWWDLMKFWVLEGTAVYAADQALIPTCSTDSSSPPRLPGVTYPNDCRAPNIHERDSEVRLSDETDSLFREPWHGMTRDTGKGGTATAYSSVLFWYYVQAHLQTQSGAPGGDVIKHLWKDKGGDDNALQDWALRLLPEGGLEELYHDYMVDNYLRTLPAPAGGFDNPYFDSYTKWRKDPTASTWKESNWYVDSDTAVKFDTREVFSATLGTPSQRSGDDGLKPIDYLGTRYYAIDVDPSTPVTATLEVSFRPDEDTSPYAYAVTFLHVTTSQTSTVPLVVHDAQRSFGSEAGQIFQVSGLGSHAGSGQRERVIAVVSKVLPDVNAKYTVAATIFGDVEAATQPIALPNPFSPDDNGHQDTTFISYKLPALLTNTLTNYNVSFYLADPGEPELKLDEEMQQPGEQKWQWVVLPETRDFVTEGEHTIKILVEEATNGVGNGNIRAYITKVSVDLQAPPSIVNLQLTPAQTGHTMTWTSIVTGTASLGVRYLVFSDIAPFTDIDTATAYQTLTTTSTTVPRSIETRYYAVVAEDSAGNRSAPAFIVAEGLKIDVALIIDDTGSMGYDLDSYTTGIDESIAFVERLQQGDSISVIRMSNPSTAFPMTIINDTTRAAAIDYLLTIGLPGGDIPADPSNQALTIAIQQLPSNERPQSIIVFSDGGEFYKTDMEAVADAHPTIFAIATPEADIVPMQAVVDLTNSAAEGVRSQLFVSDIGGGFLAAEQMRFEVANVDSESVAPGSTTVIPYPIDRTIPEANIRVTWDSSGRTPKVTLLSPLGHEISSDNLPTGAFYNEAPGEATFSLELPPLPHGLWQIQVSNPAGGPAGGLMAAQPSPYFLDTMLSVSSPAIKTSQARLQPLISSQNGAAESIDFTVQQAATSSLTTTVRLIDPKMLELTMLDAGQPLSENTAVWAVLQSSNSITHTLLLQDNGTSGDSVIHDGRYVGTFDESWGTGLFTMTLSIRSYDDIRGYIEREMQRKIYIGLPDLQFHGFEWSDGQNGDGIIDPGDTISVTSQIYNAGDGMAFQPVGTLVPTSPYIQTGNSVVSYPSMIAYSPFRSSTQPYTFTISSDTPVGTTLTFEHQVTLSGQVVLTTPIELQVGTPDLFIQDVRWTDSINDDGSADPGDTIAVQIDVLNDGDGTAGNVHAVITALTNMVTIGTDTSPYQTIPVGEYATNTVPFTLTVDPTALPGSIASFEQVITSGTVVTRTFNIPVGVSQFGETTTYTATDTPREIPDADEYGESSEIYIDDVGRIGDINVRVSATHPALDELTFTLVSPQGTEVQLARRPSSAGSNFADTRFDDHSDVPINSATAPFTGVYQPEQPLGTVTGESFQGSWFLRATDALSGSVGTIDDWSLEVRPLVPVCWPQGNDFCPPTATLTPTSTDLLEGEGGSYSTMAVFTVTLDRSVQQWVAVHYRTVDETARGTGFALDYVEQTGWLYFAPGEMEKTISIQVFNSTTIENDETFKLQLEWPSNLIIRTPEARITILDDDAPATITMASPSITATENQIRTVTIQLAQPARRTTRVNYATRSGTAVAGSDFTSVTGTVNFSIGQQVQTISVPILNDTTPEPDEAFYVDLSSAVNGVLGTPKTTTITIEANGCTDLLEPDNSTATAQPISVGQSQNHAFCTFGDVDWATFSAQAGTTYWIETRNPESGVDTVLELYGSDGTTVLGSDDDGGDNQASRIKWVASSAGTYYLKVRRFSNKADPTATYTLWLFSMSASTPQPTTQACTDVHEPNNTWATAQVIPFTDYFFQQQRLCIPGDSDWFSWQAIAGTTYRISAIGVAPFVDPVVEVYASDGTTLLMENDDAYSINAEVYITATVTGTHYVKVRHASLFWGDPSFTYNIEFSTE